MGHCDDFYDEIDKIEDEKAAKRREQLEDLRRLSFEEKINAIFEDLLSSKTNIEISRMHNRFCKK